MINLMDKHLLTHAAEGVISMVNWLKERGYPVAPKQIRRLCKLMGHQTQSCRKKIYVQLG
jgi:hypothetical protein